MKLIRSGSFDAFIEKLWMCLERYFTGSSYLKVVNWFQLWDRGWFFFHSFKSSVCVSAHLCMKKTFLFFWNGVHNCYNYFYFSHLAVAHIQYFISESQWEEIKNWKSQIFKSTVSFAMVHMCFIYLLLPVKCDFYTISIDFFLLSELAPWKGYPAKSGRMFNELLLLIDPDISIVITIWFHLKYFFVQYSLLNHK